MPAGPGIGVLEAGAVHAAQADRRSGVAPHQLAAADGERRQRIDGEAGIAEAPENRDDGRQPDVDEIPRLAGRRRPPTGSAWPGRRRPARRAAAPAPGAAAASDRPAADPAVPVRPARGAAAASPPLLSAAIVRCSWSGSIIAIGARQNVQAECVRDVDGGAAAGALDALDVAPELGRPRRASGRGRSSWRAGRRRTSCSGRAPPGSGTPRRSWSAACPARRSVAPGSADRPCGRRAAGWPRPPPAPSA